MKLPEPVRIDLKVYLPFELHFVAAQRVGRLPGQGAVTGVIGGGVAMWNLITITLQAWCVSNFLVRRADFEKFRVCDRLSAIVFVSMPKLPFSFYSVRNQFRVDHQSTMQLYLFA